MKVLPFTIPVLPNKTLLIQVDEMPHFYPYLHRHKETQLTWVQRGEGTLVAGMNMQIFKPNEIYLIGGNIPHIFKSNPEYFTEASENIKTLTIFFNPDDKLSCLFDLPELLSIKDFFKEFDTGFKIPGYAYQEICKKFTKVANSEDLEQFINFLDLLKALINLKEMEPLTTNTFLYSFNDRDGSRISSIYNYIIQNYNKPLTLEDIAQQACMTPPAFCRYFKKHTRYTLISFLNVVRVNEACRMLTEGLHDGIASIAYSCGFNSITSFNRVFKSITGKSPREFKNQL